jgi:serine phosphatase RsbU (regulator of sigma subunit)
MTQFSSSHLQTFSHLLTARLSRRVMGWIFASLFLIEAVILVPSVQRREQELLTQLQRVSSGKVLWITATYPNASPTEFLAQVKRLQSDPMVYLLGGTLYQANGQAVGTFGESPTVTFAEVMTGNPMNFEMHAQSSQSNRYDVTWSIPHAGGNYFLVMRHDSSRVRLELRHYIFRIVGLVMLIAAVLTLTTLTVMSALVITPILRLRQDLLLAGEVIRQDQLATHFYAATVCRQDELGDVIAAFRQMFQQIWQTMSDRKSAEQQLAIANQEITRLNQKLTVENLRMAAELEVSRKLQQMLIPAQLELDQVPGLDLSGFMEPATEVGGDYFDVLNHNGTIKVSIGDVTGHGLESGVLMMMTQTATRTLLTHGETDPVKFLNTLNRTLYGNIERMNCDKSITLTLLDYQNGTIRLSGQHEEVLIIRKNGKIERIDTINLGFPLALEPDISEFIAELSIDLNSGDGIVLYTDGIPEARNSDRECYGLDRLCQVVQRNWEKPAMAIQQAVIKDVQSFIDTQAIADDITLLVLKQK